MQPHSVYMSDSLVGGTWTGFLGNESRSEGVTRQTPQTYSETRHTAFSARLLLKHDRRSACLLLRHDCWPSSTDALNNTTAARLRMLGPSLSLKPYSTYSEIAVQFVSLQPIESLCDHHYIIFGPLRSRFVYATTRLIPSEIFKETDTPCRFMFQTHIAKGRVFRFEFCQISLRRRVAPIASRRFDDLSSRMSDGAVRQGTMFLRISQ